MAKGGPVGVEEGVLAGVRAGREAQVAAVMEPASWPAFHHASNAHCDDADFCYHVTMLSCQQYSTAWGFHMHYYMFAFRYDGFVDSHF